MSSKFQNSKDFLGGMVLAGGIALPTMFMNGYLDPAPYSNVEILGATSVDDGTVITASFLKTSHCDFKKMAVFGKDLGYWVELNWQDIDGEKGDRMEGYQSFVIKIDTMGSEYSEIEIRTRHDCDGGITDTVFAKIDMSDIN